MRQKNIFYRRLNTNTIEQENSPQIQSLWKRLTDRKCSYSSLVLDGHCDLIVFNEIDLDVFFGEIESKDESIYSEEYKDYLRKYPYSTEGDFFKDCFLDLKNFSTSFSKNKAFENTDIESDIYNVLLWYEKGEEDYIGDFYAIEKTKNLKYYQYYFNQIHSRLEKIEWNIKFPPSMNGKQVVSNSKLKWSGSDIEFCELVKALHEVKAFGDVLQRDVLKELNELFQVGLTTTDITSGKKLNDLKKRNSGSETLYLDKLKKALNSWINKKDT